MPLYSRTVEAVQWNGTPIDMDTSSWFSEALNERELSYKNTDSGLKLMICGMMGDIEVPRQAYVVIKDNGDIGYINKSNFEATYDQIEPIAKEKE
jgi:hypothetical protein